MKAWEIVGYAFDADKYCVDHAPNNPTECTCKKLDENGLCMDNCHGYGPNPILAGDENRGICGDCLEEI